MRAVVVLVFVLCQYSGISQQLAGFYSGELKINRVVMGAQLDLIPGDGGYTAIFRTRYPENNVITGCDNVLFGKLERQILKLEMKVVIKETEVPVGSCNYFNTLRLQLKQNGDLVEATGELLGNDGLLIGRLNLNRIDTALSFTVKEELQEATRKLGEAQIGLMFDEEKRAEMMLEIRETDFLDSLQIPVNEAKVKVVAPDADRFHKISIFVNGNPVMVNKAPKQTPFQITLKELPPGETLIYIICHHYLVDVYFPAKVQVSSGEKIFQVEVPVSTGRNQVIKLIRPVIAENQKP